MISAREQPSVGAPSASPSAATSRQPRIRSYNGTRPMQLVPFSIASLMPHWPTIAAFPAGCSGERGDDPSGGLLRRNMLPDAKDRPAGRTALDRLADRGRCGAPASAPVMAVDPG